MGNKGKENNLILKIYIAMLLFGKPGCRYDLLGFYTGVVGEYGMLVHEMDYPVTVLLCRA